MPIQNEEPIAPEEEDISDEYASEFENETDDYEELDDMDIDMEGDDE